MIFNTDQYKKQGKQVIVVILLIVLAYAFGRYAQPAKVVIQTKEVIKTIDNTQDHTKTAIKEIDKPDGTKEIDTTIVQDKDTEDTTVDDKETTKTVENAKPQWKVDLTYGYKSFNLTTPIYGGMVEKRLIGPISVGIWGNTDGAGGVAVGIEL